MSDTPLKTTTATQFEPRGVDTAKVRDDLGIGRIASEQSAQRFLKRDGSFNTARVGLGGWASFSPYYWLLSVSWGVFFGVAALAFIVINLVFAGLYMLCGANALSSSASLNQFEKALFFSVETLSTIGYGHIAPNTLAAHWLSTVQAFFGLCSVAVLTGLVFAKFSKPAARILFSERALVAPFQNGTGLMLRVTNGLKNEIIEIQAQITLSRFEQVNGQRTRRFHPLKLERNQVAFFNLSWTLVHPITPESPLWGVTETELLESEAEILVVIHGVDDIMFQRVHTRSSYKADEVVWSARFADMYVRLENGSVAVDARRLSLYEVVE
jgi:inward rectifier potassium channel